MFLNNDTVPQPGWLDALLRTFDEHPDAGLAGAQLLYPDGRLQEAGGVVFADGSALELRPLRVARRSALRLRARGRLLLSGAAIAIPRALFAELGGFDTRYAPAYYEDTDLAFAVRARGLRVLYQPASRVVHVEGATAGTDTGSGVKAYQVRNQRAFRRQVARRAGRAARRRARLPTPAALHARTPQVLVIDALTPQPDHDSGSLRLVNLMRLLREEGAHVVFLPANRAHDGALHRKRCSSSGVEAWHAPFAARAPAWLREHGRASTRSWCAAITSRANSCRCCAGMRRRRAIVFDTVDLHYLREQPRRRARRRRRPARASPSARARWNWT